ncbi:MAG: hypothetical protein PHF63_00925 [Herbinix sp.]|nr:hypothetical protein [Herbinix sp.]
MYIIFDEDELCGVCFKKSIIKNFKRLRDMKRYRIEKIKNNKIPKKFREELESSEYNLYPIDFGFFENYNGIPIPLFGFEDNVFEDQLLGQVKLANQQIMSLYKLLKHINISKKDRKFLKGFLDELGTFNDSLIDCLYHEPDYGELFTADVFRFIL